MKLCKSGNYGRAKRCKTCKYENTICFGCQPNLKNGWQKFFKVKTFGQRMFERFVRI